MTVTGLTILNEKILILQILQEGYGMLPTSSVTNIVLKNPGIGHGRGTHPLLLFIERESLYTVDLLKFNK